MEYTATSMITVAETEPFQKKVSQLLTDEEKSLIFQKTHKAASSFRIQEVFGSSDGRGVAEGKAAE